MGDRPRVERTTSTAGIAPSAERTDKARESAIEAPERLDGERCLECIDGWVPGDHGIERCDTCQRFKSDDEAAAHLSRILDLLQASYDRPDATSWAAPGGGGIEWLRSGLRLVPTCGHSVCSQNYIDTGETECVRDSDGPL